MEITNSIEHELWPDFPIAESYPEHLSWDPLVNHQVAQSDWLVYNDDETSELNNEASSLASSTSAAEFPGDFGSWWPDSSAQNDCSIPSSVQSPLGAAAQDHLTEHLSSKSLPVPGNHTRSKSHPRLPSDAVKALRSWLYQHQEFPYPNPEERVQLEQQTGLTKNQVLNWFANARRRRQRHVDQASAPSMGDSKDAGTSLSPLERWKQSPPESEPAATSDIIRALDNASSYPEQSQVYYNDLVGTVSRNSSGSSGSSFLFGAPSMSGFEHSASSGSEVSVTHVPRRNQRPPTPIPSMGRRHRRRKNSRPAGQQNKSKAQGSRMYQCTFCCDSFRTKYEWTRHEKAIHISVEMWHCAPVGGIAELDGVSICVFCQAQDADDNHLETHNYLRCRDKPLIQREFARKDHLRQHLRLMHNIKDHNFLDSWRISFPELNSRCGFCSSTFTTWDARVDHLAEHFKTGADMSQWTGNWGFDPEVERQVRNAMPAWVLGQERATMHPMKMSDATQHGDDFISSANEFPKGVDLYMILRNGLISYIKDQIAMGIYPSDENISAAGRLMIFGTDDPWNQTFAENPIWLEALKNDVRFGTSETLPGRHIASRESFM
ncbi:uncharacterized protein N7496_011807 [Penicillium cataractarum]|uniref:Homeobox domain-containing protein n=1 Tax=Penicillium cataractarum TaxID=2100454 RepID=A0A9W9UWM6_9EURO|nr:uncharacterized protein N7496_011807 [Penicillium cataractarum]KAJ5359394.1 hypothetical protein N7496_011807 [Penicillium cataractarum]